MPTATAVRMETEFSVVVPNEPGQLARLTGALRSAGVDLSGILCVHDGGTARVRFTVRGSCEQARRWLERSGYHAAESPVFALEEAAGSDLAHRVASALGCSGINILSCRSQDAGGVLRLVLSVDRPDEARQVLAELL